MKRTYLIAAVVASLLVAGVVGLDRHDSDVQIESARPGPHPGLESLSEPSTLEKRAQFDALSPTPDARQAADWVVRSGDHGALPFLIIDKKAALIYVFDSGGRAHASSPVLLGIARGDRFEAGSAEKDMRNTAVGERITPAGRFLAERGTDDKGHDVVWIHYDAGIALHAVLDNAGERRRERLETSTPDDNRVSYGCVNLPGDFFRSVVRPIFERTRAFVYVLPDGEGALELFARAGAETEPSSPVARSAMRRTDAQGQ